MQLKEGITKSIRFKNSFEWGAAFSGPQTENDRDDGKSASVWDDWYATEPSAFWDNEFVLTNYRKDYPQVIAHAKQIGVKALRTSIQWSRFMPDGHNVSPSALNYYRKLFGMMRKSGIKPLACLMHFDVPMFLHKQGGFENRAAIKMFVCYAEKAFALLGDLVHDWFTFNEPHVLIEAGYLGKQHKPQVISMKRAMQVQHHYLMAHLQTVAAFRAKHRGRIGVILNITPAIPRGQTKAELAAASWADLFHYRVYLDVILLGQYPQKLVDDAQKYGYMWTITLADYALMHNYARIDVLGINYYTPVRTRALRAREKSKWSNTKPPSEQYFKTYYHPEAIINEHRGWEVLPEKIYDILMMIKDQYNNQRTFVSENGIGISNEEQFRSKHGKISDHYRIRFIKDHLYWVNKAIKNGANCFGYHVWTLIDNWSWLNSYKNRYGLIEFNKDKQEFHPKASAAWFKKLIKNAGFTISNS